MVTDPTVIVCGGRDYQDRQRVFDELDGIEPGIVIEGGATGADCWAAEWAVAHDPDVLHLCVSADWKGRGRAAGPIRNRTMLTKYKPDLVLAFPGGRGTANMVKLAREAGVEVREIRP